MMPFMANDFQTILNIKHQNMSTRTTRALSRNFGDVAFFIQFGKIPYWVIGNENSRETLQNLGITHDFEKKFYMEWGLYSAPLDA